MINHRPDKAKDNKSAAVEGEPNRTDKTIGDQAEAAGRTGNLTNIGKG